MTKRFRIYHHMLDDVRASRGSDDPFSEEIGKVSRLYKMMEVEIPIILERWKKLSFP